MTTVQLTLTNETALQLQAAQLENSAEFENFLSNAIEAWIKRRDLEQREARWKHAFKDNAADFARDFINENPVLFAKLAD